MPTTVKSAASKLPKRDLEKFRRALIDLKRELTRDLSKTRDAGEENADEFTQDLADKATSAYTREFLFSLGDTERTRLQQIDAALVRVGEGAFGNCTNCAQPIQEKRLTAIPWTPYCVDCMELSEKGMLG